MYDRDLRGRNRMIQPAADFFLALEAGERRRVALHPEVRHLHRHRLIAVPQILRFENRRHPTLIDNLG